MTTTLAASRDAADNETPEDIEFQRSWALRRLLDDPDLRPAQIRPALRDPNPAVRRAALRHPHCSRIQRLATIETDPDPEVRGVAVRVLDSYADIPDDVLDSGPWQVRWAVLQRRDCPVSVRRQQVVHDPDAEVRRRTLMLAGVLTAELQWRVLHGPVSHDAELLLDHRDLDLSGPPQQVLAIPHTEVRERILRDHSDEALVALLAHSDPSPRIRILAVTDRRFPATDLPGILQDRNKHVRCAAVRRPSFPTGDLHRAVADRSGQVRTAVLSHPDLSADLVDRLAQDAKISVAKRALRHPHCPAVRLAACAASERPVIRAAALSGPNCPADAITSGCADPDVEVRAAAFSQPAKVPVAVALRGLRDADRFLTQATEHGPARVERAHVAIRDHSLTALAGASWQDLSPLPLGSLRRAQLERVIAAHLADAGNDRRICVRLAAAGHPEVTAAVLTTLSHDPDERVRAAVSRRLLEVM